MKEFETAEQVCQGHGLVDEAGGADPAVVAAMEEYSSQFKPRWIKIKSETDLPNSDDVFWIMLIDGTFWPASYYAKLSVFSKDGKLFTTEYVTHYAPIIKPKPPKQD